MPVELLPFPPSYCVVGAYRFVTDETLWRPIWTRSRVTLKRGLLAAVPFTLVSYPLTRLYVTLILARSPFSPSNIHDAAFFGISVVRYTTLVLVLGQISMILEWSLSRQLKKGREEVYEATVRSRGKTADFWQPYVEEWSVPPLERATRNAEKQAFYMRLTSPLVRIIVLKVLLTPLSFIPGLSLLVTATLRCLTLARQLHQPFFAAKKMKPFDVELWMVERTKEYRMFGFVASLLERLPLVGLVFSVSNRIGAAMWAHDLEKRQHEFREGKIAPTKVYTSKTAALPPADLPSEFVGGFPTTKAGRPAVVPPPLPPRS